LLKLPKNRGEILNIYYYVHTGHRFGLDRFRGAVSLIHILSKLNITLLTSDYRIASSSKEYGIQKAIGLDVLRNIPNVAQHGDILIYDSNEHNEQQLIEMNEFFSKFIRVSLNRDDYPQKGEFLISPYIKDSQNSFQYLPVESSYFGNFDKKMDTLLFFGDDDYDKDLIRYLKNFKKLRPDILLGFYYFLGYENELKEFANKIYENEEYKEVIKSSKQVITSSYQTALQTLASGGEPIYIERSDRDDSPNRYLESFGIPILKDFNEDNILATLQSQKSYKKFENREDALRESIYKFLGV